MGEGRNCSAVGGQHLKAENYPPRSQSIFLPIFHFHFQFTWAARNKLFFFLSCCTIPHPNTSILLWFLNKNLNFHFSNNSIPFFFSNSANFQVSIQSLKSQQTNSTSSQNGEWTRSWRSSRIRHFWGSRERQRRDQREPSTIVGRESSTIRGFVNKRLKTN